MYFAWIVVELLSFKFGVSLVLVLSDISRNLFGLCVFSGEKQLNLIPLVHISININIYIFFILFFIKYIYSRDSCNKCTML